MCCSNVMINPKQEFLEHIEYMSLIPKCANILILGKGEFNLKVNYSLEDYDNFLNSLDLEYEDNPDLKLTRGCIWYKDSDEWSERVSGGGEMGLDSWCNFEYPVIPFKLKN